VYSVIVPLPSVVVVVVVVSETCAHANGATTANAMLKSNFFMISPFLLSCGNINASVPVKFENPENLPLHWIRIQDGPRMFEKFFCVA
jgi:hypothetical protein